MHQKSWDDRVVEAVHALQARDESDKQWFHDLYRYMNTRRAFGDGETLIREAGAITKRYKGEPVFSVGVNKGMTVVQPTGQPAETYSDREQALDRMAALTAQAVHDPDWGKQDEDAPARQPRKPLYPV